MYRVRFLVLVSMILAAAASRLIPHPVLPLAVRQRRGQKGGEFYTPRCVVKLLVEVLEPYRGRAYDRCCGSEGIKADFILANPPFDMKQWGGCRLWEDRCRPYTVQRVRHALG